MHPERFRFLPMSSAPEEDRRVLLNVRHELETRGLDLGVVEDWKMSDKASGIIETAIKNIEQLSAIEYKRPGIGRTLHEIFGISNFARYPKKMLLRQYDKLRKRSKPYGVIIYPKYDHNGAFYRDREVMARLSRKLKGKYHIRVWEVRNLMKLVATLTKSRRRWGKISFAVIGGHGETNSIRFGSNKEEVLQQSDIGRKGAESH